jgi:hypothetical protein
MCRAPAAAHNHTTRATHNRNTHSNTRWLLVQAAGPWAGQLQQQGHMRKRLKGAANGCGLPSSPPPLPCVFSASADHSLACSLQEGWQAASSGACATATHACAHTPACDAPQAHTCGCMFTPTATRVHTGQRTTRQRDPNASADDGGSERAKAAARHLPGRQAEAGKVARQPGLAWDFA